VLLLMKKHPHSTKQKKKSSPSLSSKEIIGPDDPLNEEVSPDEVEILAEEQPVVSGREEEATTSGHQIPKIEPNDENNAQELIEEGLHGYMHTSLTKPLRKSK
jgi:hypothetical protein